MIVRRLSKRESTIFILCVMTILVYVGYTFAFRNFKERFDDLQRAVDAHERKLQKNIHAIQQEAAIDARYRQYAPYLKQASSNEQEMTTIVAEIGDVAEEVALRVADLKPKRVRKVDFYNTFSVSLTVDGDLLTVMHFLHILQNRPHLFGIEEVHLEQGSRRTSKIKCRMTLSRALIP